jgi:hypothetical protein
MKITKLWTKKFHNIDPVLILYTFYSHYLQLWQNKLVLFENIHASMHAMDGWYNLFYLDSK